MNFMSAFRVSMVAQYAFKTRQMKPRR